MEYPPFQTVLLSKKDIDLYKSAPKQSFAQKPNILGQILQLAK
jgi:hypothetical protein